VQLCDRALAGGPLWSISPIGARVALWNRANGKRAIFRVFQQEMSSRKIKIMFRGMQCKCLEAMFQRLRIVKFPRASCCKSLLNSHKAKSKQGDSCPITKEREAYPYSQQALQDMCC